MDAQRSDRRNRLARFASASGTAYVVLSVFPLCFLLVATRGWPSQRATVVATTLFDGREYDGFGLTYEGLWGGLLLWGELCFVIAALFVSNGGGRLARVAHMGLVAWASMLAANCWWVVVAGGYRAAAWMLPIVTVGAALVVLRWRLKRLAHP